MRKNDEELYYLGQKLRSGVPYLESLSQKFVAGNQNRDGAIRQVKEIGNDQLHKVVSLKPKIRDFNELNRNSSLAIATTQDASG